jgi:hypothetical protein
MATSNISGVLVTLTPSGKILSRTFQLSCPSPHDFPFTREDGTTQHFFPGASLTRFPIGGYITEASHG